MLKKTVLFIYTLLFSFSGLLQAQLTVTRNANAMQLAQRLAGPGITVSNAVINCPEGQSGTFVTGLAAINIAGGIVLGSEVVEGNAPLFGGGGPGDPDLEGIINDDTYDACALEFDIDVISSKIQFNFVFASDEYPEYTDDPYNDVFGYLISGPGIAGVKNIAVVPGTTTPVSIKSINNGPANNGPCNNCAFYRPNRAGATGYDGTTTLLTAQSDVEACNTYHLKLAIADVVDGLLASAVFLEENSLVSVGVNTLPPIVSNNTQDTIFEGCDNAEFKFQLSTTFSEDYTFPIVVKGTSTPGTDYPTPPATLTIPAGQTEVSITIDPIDDGIDEVPETIEICAIDPCTGDELSCQTVQIVDFFPEPTPDVQLCYGESTTLGITDHPDYTYSWTPATNLSCTNCSSPVATPTATTTYKGTVTVQNCTKEFDILVEVAPEKLPDLDDLAGCEDDVLTGISGQIPDVTYSWDPITGVSDPSSPNPSFTVQNTPITYTLTATHPFGCTYTETRTVTPFEPVDISFTKVNVLCFGDNTGSIAVTKSSADPVSYLWNDGVNTKDRNNIPAGDYTLTVTSGNGCEKEIDVTIEEPSALLEVEAEKLNNSYCNAQDGLAEATVTGGVEPYTYRWSPAGGNAAQTTPLFPGIDTCIVTDANGCIAKDTVEIAVDGFQKDATITPAGPFCTISDDFQLTTAMPGGVWQGVGVNATGLFSPANSGDGNHQIIYTIDDGLCGDADTIYILVNSAFQADINDAGPFCSLDAPFTLTSVTPGGEWSGNGITNINSSVFDPAVAGPGTHKIYHLIPGDCGELDSTLITVMAPVVATFTNVPDFCPSGSTAQLTATPAGGTWQGSGIDPSTGTFIPNSVGTGTYPISYTAPGSCVLPADTVVVVVDTLKATADNFALACFGDANASLNTATTGGRQPLSYSWSNDPGITTANATGLSEGSYTVTVTDNLGCSTTVVHTVTEPTMLTFSQTPVVVDNTCNGSNDGSVQLFPQGGTTPYAYSISPGAGSYNGTNGFTNLPANTYTLTITDDNGCTISQTVTVTEPAAFAVTSTINSGSCGKPNGDVLVNTVTGGTSPYTFQWDDINNSTTQSLTGVVGGTYNLLITDDNGCTYTEQFIVPDTPGPTVSFTVTDPTCFNGADGSITATPSGTSTYSYNWQGTGVTTATISGITAGMYTLILTDDADGCTSTNTVSVTQPSQVVVADIPDQLLCDGEVFNASFGATGGSNSGYIFSVNGSVITGATYAITAAGTYTIDVTDGNGCVGIPDIIEVTYRSPLSVTVPPSFTVCPGDVVTIAATGSGGLTPYTYTWSDGQIGPVINYNTDESTQDVTLSVTIDDGCSIPTSASTLVDTYTVPILAPTAVPQQGCEPLVTKIDLNETNVTDVLWDMGDGSQVQNQTVFDYIYDASGSYPVSVTALSHDGCALSGNIPGGVDVFPLPYGTIRFLNDERLSIINNVGSFSIQSTEFLGQVNWTLSLNGEIVHQTTGTKFIYTFPDSVTTYVLTADFLTPFGCPGTASIKVPVYNEYFLYIPNTFTPDGDGYNDLFSIAWDRFLREGFEITIWDRWGELMFESSDPDFVWDGKYHGEFLMIGTYVYQVKFKTLEGDDKVEFGHINILR